MTVCLNKLPGELYARIGSFLDPSDLSNMEQALDSSLTEPRLLELTKDMIVVATEREGEILAHAIVAATRLGFSQVRDEFLDKLRDCPNVSKGALDIICKAAGESGDFSLMEIVGQHRAFVGANYIRFFIEYLLSTPVFNSVAISTLSSKLNVEADTNLTEAAVIEIGCRDFKRGTFWHLNRLLEAPANEQSFNRIIDRLIQDKDLSTLNGLFMRCMETNGAKIAGIVYQKMSETGFPVDQMNRYLKSNPRSIESLFIRAVSSRNIPLVEILLNHDLCSKKLIQTAFNELVLLLMTVPNEENLQLRMLLNAYLKMDSRSVHENSLVGIDPIIHVSHPLNVQQFLRNNQVAILATAAAVLSSLLLYFSS